MRTSVSASWLLSTFVAVGSAQVTPLATVTPCPSCPSSIAPAPITVTSQFQGVSTCVPSTSCTASTSGTSSSSSCQLVPSCSNYNFVSSTIPFAGGNTVVTKTDQAILLSHASQVLTYDAPCPTITASPFNNGTFRNVTSVSSCTSKTYQTVVVDIYASFNQIGPLALPQYGGSGLCGQQCEENPSGTRSQIVTVTKCVNAGCTTYAETWVSVKPTPATSTATASFSSSTFLPSSGVYTFPVVTTYTPAGPVFTQPVPTSFAIVTSVDRPQYVDLTRTIIVVYYAPAPAATQSVSTTTRLSTTTSAPSNGVYTVTIIGTATPTQPGYTAPVTTTAVQTTTVTNAPINITINISVVITFYSTITPQTVIDGTTQSQTSTPTAPATNSASATQTGTETGTATGTSSGTETGTSSGTETGTSSGTETGTVTGTETGTVTGTNTATGTTLSTLTSGGSVTVTDTVTDTVTGTTTTATTATATATSGVDPNLPRFCSNLGCYSTGSDFGNFRPINTGANRPGLCCDDCTDAGFPYSGTFQGVCYCAPNLQGAVEASPAQCNTLCPGSSTVTCGGTGGLSRRQEEGGIFFNVVENPTLANPTTTSSSSTTAATAEPSSGADTEEFERRHLHDGDHKRDNEWNSPVDSNGGKVRRGGLLKGNRVEKVNVLAKRDFGVKRPFGI